MSNRFAGVFRLCVLGATVLCAPIAAQTVRFRTTLGDIDVNLLPNVAPATVANFLNYMNRGDFNRSIFHRSVSRFIIQGGGYQYKNGAPVEIPADPPVKNEYGVSNTRGTLAMAKLDGDPNSATNQWFFNLQDSNASNLNNQNGGFTVFGRVTSAAGLAVMDRIAAVPVPGVLPSPFDQIPLINYKGGDILEANLVLVTSITKLDTVTPPSIQSNGISTAAAFGGAAVAAPGSYIEILGANLAGAISRGWTAADFVSGVAPLGLEGVSVSVGNVGAYVNYVSPNQINVQVPAGVSTNSTAQVIVTYNGQASTAAPLAIKPYAGGLLAPSWFKVGDKQFVAAYHASGNLVSDGSIPDLPVSPARPGETLVFYGVGFGAITPTTPFAGQTARIAGNLSTPVKFKFGEEFGQVVSAGLAVGAVGLYQFSVTVPTTAPSGDLPLEITQGTDVLPQSLFISVRSPQN